VRLGSKAKLVRVLTEEKSYSAYPVKFTPLTTGQAT
jgi:hypothetical protein